MNLKNEESSNLEKSLIEQVSFLLDNKSCIDFLSSSDNFQKIIKNELLILNYFVIKNKSDKKTVNAMVDKYNSICLKNTLSLKDEQSIKSEEEMLDYANYLKVYVKNILHFNLLEAIKEPNKVNDLKFTAPIGDIPNNNFNPYSAENGNWQNMFEQNMESINPYVLREAQNRVRAKIESDEVYIFKSKPKHIKVLKIIYSILMFSFAFLLLCLSIVGFIVANKPTGAQTQSGDDIKFGFWTPVFLLIFSLCFGYFGFINIAAYFHAWKRHTKPSENAVYSVIAWYIGFSMIFSVFFAVYLMWPVMGNGAKTIFQYLSLYGDRYDGLTKVCVLIMMIIEVLLLCISLCSLILGIVLITTKPKQDEDAIKKLLFQEIVAVSKQQNSSLNEQPINLTPDKPKDDSSSESDKPADSKIKN